MAQAVQIQKGEVILRFDKASFAYGRNKPILREVDFTVRQGSKITLMGQNGAGKSTIFQLITKALEPESGTVHVADDITIAMSCQVIAPIQMDNTVQEFFEACFAEKVYNIDPKIDAILEVVNLPVKHDRIIRSFSGGQRARLLLAS